jgi:hypothetical protein
MNTVVQTYQITLPVETGEIFGIREIVNGEKRREKVLVLEDSFLISITKEHFFESIREVIGLID